MDDEAVSEAFVGRPQGMSSDSLCAIGYAFARSATMLPMFRELGASLECAWRKPLAGTSSREEREHLSHAFRVFLTKSDAGSLRSLERNKQKAYVMKTDGELMRAWDLILERRRLVEPDDTIPITCPRRLGEMWTSWMCSWFQAELTREQRQRKHCQKSSMFSAWIQSVAGGKFMVMTIWQTGIVWAPRGWQSETDAERAAEHVATQLAAWTRRFARALTLHKNHPDSIVARRRSGYPADQHGLTREELRAWGARQIAEENYYEAIDLQNKIRRGKRERVDGSGEKLLHDLRNGSLR